MRLYSDRESDHLSSVAGSGRSEAFLTLWTRKESYVKAVGAGMSMPFDEFDVLTPDGSHIGRPRGHHGDLPFAFMSLGGFDGYIGAVTVSGTSIVTRDMSLTVDPHPVRPSRPQAKSNGNAVYGAVAAGGAT